MFNGVVINPEHVLHQFVTERQQTYNVRRRPHGSKTQLKKTQSLSEQDFLYEGINVSHISGIIYGMSSVAWPAAFALTAPIGS